AIGKPVMLQGNVALIDVQDRRSILTIVRPIAWQWFVRDEGAPDGVDAGGENRIGDPLALGLGCGIHPFAEPDGADFGAMDGAAFVGKDGAVEVFVNRVMAAMQAGEARGRVLEHEVAGHGAPDAVRRMIWQGLAIGTDD